jgi:retron-type reverse transcriptase
LEKVFDRVNHDKLMGQIAKRIEDKRLLKLIRVFLNAGQWVMKRVVQFITQELNLKVNETKSVVARPQERKFLGFRSGKHRQGGQ